MNPAAVNGLLLWCIAMLTLLLAMSLVVVFQWPSRIANPLNRAARSDLGKLKSQFADELVASATYTTHQTGRTEIRQADIQAEYQKRRRTPARHTFPVLVPIRLYGGITLGTLEVVLWLYDHKILPSLPPVGARLIPVIAALAVALAMVRDVTEFLHDPDRRRVSLESANKSASRESLRCAKRIARDVRKQARSTASKTGRAGWITPQEIRIAWNELVLNALAAPAVPEAAVVPAARVGRSRAEWTLRGVGVLSVAAIIYLAYELHVTRLSQGSYLSAGLIAATLVMVYLTLAYGLVAVNVLWRKRQKLFSDLGEMIAGLPKIGNLIRPTEPELPALPSSDASRLDKGGTSSYGGPTTKRVMSPSGLPRSFAGWIGLIFEALGILNKGSVRTAAAPDSSDVAKLQPISSNTLNATRVGGIGALISAAGGAALLLFKVNRRTDHALVVVAAYASVGVIVAAALLTVAVIISADIRARTAIATANAPPAKPNGMKRVSAGGTTSLDHVYDCVLVDAGAASVELALPSAESVSWQQMIIKREDGNASHIVTLRPQGHQTITGQADLQLTPGNSLHIYSNGQVWLTL